MDHFLNGIVSHRDREVPDVSVFDDDVVNFFLAVGADLGHSYSLALAAMDPLAPAWL